MPVTRPSLQVSWSQPGSYSSATLGNHLVTDFGRRPLQMLGLHGQRLLKLAMRSRTSLSDTRSHSDPPRPGYAPLLGWGLYQSRHVDRQSGVCGNCSELPRCARSHAGASYCVGNYLGGSGCQSTTLKVSAIRHRSHRQHIQVRDQNSPEEGRRFG